MNVMEQVIDVPQQEVTTKDNASVAVDGIVQVFESQLRYDWRWWGRDPIGSVPSRIDSVLVIARKGATSCA
jgi:hypothetical protein